MDENGIGRLLINTSLEIHRETGPGLLERVYESILMSELRRAGLSVENQVGIAIQYKEVYFEIGFRADLLIEGKVIVELKSVDQLNDAHKKQLLSYLRLSGLKLGFLLNFGAPLMKNGIVRMVNRLPEK